MSLKKTRLAVVAGLLVLAQGAMAGGHSNMGRTVGVTCAGCHGTDGVSKGAAPSLKGLPADYLVSTMKAFKSGKRPASIMNRIAKGYTDDQIMAVAKYFSSMK